MTVADSFEEPDMPPENIAAMDAMITDGLIADAREFLTLDSVANSPSVGRLIRRLVARVESSPPLVWTDAKPTAPGDYFWRPSKDADWHSIVNYHPPYFGAVLIENTWGQFAGPIPHPADAREGDETR